MSVTPAEILELARQLLNSSEEVRHRSAASRAYYAVFHLSHETAVRHAVPDSDARDGLGMHERFFRSLERYSGPDSALNSRLQELGAWLRQCHRFRTDADYRLRDSYPLTKATQAFGACRQAEKLASELMR
jgi:hypothetical protein